MRSFVRVVSLCSTLLYGCQPTVEPLPARSPTQARAAAATPINVRVTFPCAEVDQRKLPPLVTVDYRQTGSSRWSQLTTIKREQLIKNRLELTTSKLTQGRTYDLRLRFLLMSYQRDKIAITTSSLDLPVETKFFCK